jgi:hypothetical protein
MARATVAQRRHAGPERMAPAGWQAGQVAQFMVAEV